MKKYLTPLNIIFALEVIVVALAATGLIPREAILVWTGLAIFYMVFSPVADSLWLMVASIPLFAALPVSETLDTMANWRILIAVLFLCLFFKEGISLIIVKNEAGRRRIKESSTHYALEYLTPVFLLIAASSIFMADYQILAFKKLLFLINIFLLFVVVRNKTRNKENILRVWQAAAAGGAAMLAVALVQFAAVLVVPLISFWQFWASRVINFFYGQNLADLLSYSNTWFAYYQGAPPTLRLFSVFPDSHSFAMFSLMLVPIFGSLALYFREDRRRQIGLVVLTALALGGVVFSGSRGAWLSIVPVLIVVLFFWLKNISRDLLNRAARTLAIFAVIFLLSVGYPPLFYQIQAWQTGHYSSSTLSFFERARSISDLEEVSNKGRLEIWQHSLTSLGQHPWLGVGLGNFVTVLDENIGNAKKGASAHNLYLDIAAEIGLPGLLILLLMFLDVLWSAWLVWRRASEPYFKLFGLFFGLYFVWILGYSFFDVVLLNDKVLLFFMMGLATLYSLRNIIFDPDKIWERSSQ